VNKRGMGGHWHGGCLLWFRHLCIALRKLQPEGLWEVGVKSNPLLSNQEKLPKEYGHCKCELPYHCFRFSRSLQLTANITF